MSFASQANPNQYIFGAVYGGARVNIKINTIVINI